MYHKQCPEHLYLFFACINKKFFLANFADLGSGKITWFFIYYYTNSNFWIIPSYVKNIIKHAIWDWFIRKRIRKTLCKKTQRAVKTYKLFEKIGIDKIKYLKAYSANSISELTNNQIQKIIDNISDYDEFNKLPQ